MIHRNKSKNGQRKVSPSGPTYMSNDQVASYLKDLRTNRPPRPGGSRPPPENPVPSQSPLTTNVHPRASSALALSRRSSGMPVDLSMGNTDPRSASALANHHSNSEVSLGSPAGRPLVQEPADPTSRQSISPTPHTARPRPFSPNAVYRESGQRWMERQEARSLRDALEEMDLEDERRVHAAAQDEATELVWQHQNPGVPIKNPHAPYRNPDYNSSNRFLQHLERGSHARSQSLGGYYGDRASYPGGHPEYRSSLDMEADEPVREIRSAGKDPLPRRDLASSRKPKVNFALPPQGIPSNNDRRESGIWRLKNPPDDLCPGISRNLEDQISEEPEELEQSERRTKLNIQPALKVKARNSLPQTSRPSSSRSYIHPRFENFSPRADTQTRNPLYRINPPPTPPSSDSNPDEAVRMKDGVEIRSDEIRAATTMKLKDRSAKLPMPTAVSNRPGQPIVSFDPNWKPVSEQRHRDNPFCRRRDGSSSPRTSAMSSSSALSRLEMSRSDATTTPAICPPNEGPDQNPAISISPPAPKPGSRQTASARPLPNPTPRNSKESLDPKKMAPASQSRWYSPFTRPGVPTATCVACSLPISGRLVTAAGSRFHSECFTCHHCSTPLECVAFYQEPEAKRVERLAETARNDEEATALRFYCHLDFHELFSPRCKSCKTPIEGEVVVACGAEWHVGHFFCAECGDSFTPDTPFVEKDGFAWCLRCHSRRTASRCLGCKQPVLDDVVVTALGGQWHDKCFVCHECGGGFGLEGRFFVKEGEPKRSAKGRIIGGPVQLAVCEGCEAIRLKSSP